jgi:hypothetical protein
MDGLGVNKRRIAVGVAGVAIAAGALAVLRAREDHAATIALYDIEYPGYRDWKELPAGPYGLFKFVPPDGSKIRIQGAVNRVVAEVNPTPELDTGGIAQYYVDTTRKNMPGWKAEYLGRVRAENVEFAVIQRESKVRRVLSGFAVKGNTTLIVSMTAGVENMDKVQEQVDEFQDYLSKFRFIPRTSHEDGTEEF